MSEPVCCPPQPEDGCDEHENTQFVHTSIQSFKFGGFEITFRPKIDTSHESGERALELHDNLVCIHVVIDCCYIIY